MQKTYRKYFAIFVIPTLSAFIIAFLIPFFMGIYLSFCEFRTVSTAEFVGIKNYLYVFSDTSGFTDALVFTLKFTVLAVISANIIAFALALLLTQKIKGTNAFRTIFFMPNLIGGIILGYIWQILINGILINLWNVDITFSATYGYWGLIILYNWQMIGYVMIIYIAGIQNVSTDIIEAAKVDGASAKQLLVNIILPMVMTSITICVFLTLTNAFKLFDQNLALTGGSPGGQTTMLALDIYDTYYGRVGFAGVGQAEAVVFTIIVAMVVLLQVKLSKSKEIES